MCYTSNNYLYAYISLCLLVFGITANSDTYWYSYPIAMAKNGYGRCVATERIGQTNRNCSRNDNDCR